MTRTQLLFVCSLLICSTGLAQGVLRFDMGTNSSAVASGYQPVTAATNYTAQAGFGWTLGSGQGYEQPVVLPEIPTVLDDALVRDGVADYGDLTFAVDVAAGRYHVVVYLGNVGNTVRPGARQNLDVIANGTAVVTDLDVRTLTRKAQVADAIGAWRRVPFLVTAQAGRIDLTFRCDGVGTSLNSILGVEVWPYVPAPIEFDHASGQLVADPAHAGVLTPALTAFSAGDYAGARTAFDALTDPRLRAWGYAWLLGWLTGDEDAVDTAQLELCDSLLASLGAPDDITVAGLRLELAMLREGDFYNRARGYTLEAVPGSLGSIIPNLCAANLLFEQLQYDDVLSANEMSWRAPSPLHAKAHFLQARNMHSRNTLVNEPVTNEYTATWLQMLQDLWSRQALFPKSDEAKVMGFLGSSYAIAGGIVKNWAGPASLPPVTPANTWWAPFVDIPAHANAPLWANSMRHYYRAFRNCGEWWMTRRLIAAEIGGGDGDDVEGAGLLGLASVAVREPQHVLEQGAELVMDKVLYGPSMTVSEGYFSGCGDVEHSAEFSTNPLFILMAARYGDPEYVEYALRTLRNLDDTHDPAPWTLPSGSTGRHFRAYTLGANTFCGPARDIPINMRAAVPGFAIGDYAAHPGVVQVFDQLARAWAGHAMSTAQGKPAGVFPAAVTPQPPHVFGTNGQWWENGSYIDLEGGPQYYAYLYALLQSAYAQSQAADRHIFLEPFRAAGLFLYGFRTGAVTGTAPGTPGWTANILKRVIADAVARARGLMIADPMLGLTPAELANIDAVIAAYAGAFESHVALPVTGTKPKTAFEDVFGDAATFVSHLFPLATSAVSYTDRIFIMTGGSQGTLYGAMTGASTWGILPPSVVSWTNPDPATGELDFAALVNDIQPTGLDLLVFQYATTPRDIGLRVWRTLPRGQYEARIGHDNDHDDAMDGPPHTVVPFDLAAPGATVVLPAVPEGVLQKIEIRQVSPGAGAPQLRPDPAIAADDVTFGVGGTVSVVVHNLGSAPLLGATVEVVQNSVVLASSAVPTIQPPLDYQAKTAMVSLCCASLVPNTEIEVRLTLPPGSVQVTSENDMVTVAPPGWVSFGSGCAGGAGVPSLQLASLPALGGSYALDVTGLAGGLAFLVAGFGQQSLPLQPFGLGFGPGCSLLVTVDGAVSLPQAAGSASWSLALPADPVLAGISLFSQVVEFGGVSAVSNACQAQVW